MTISCLFRVICVLNIELISRNEFDDSPDHHHARLNPEPLFPTFRYSLLADEAPTSFPRLEVYLKSGATKAQRFLKEKKN